MSNFITEDDKVSFNINFKLSIRGGIKEKEIKNKIKKEEIPLIVDLSINGFSNNEEFNLEIEGVSVKDLRKKYKKNAKKPDEISLKRACRVCRYETHDFLLKFPDTQSFIYKKINNEEKEQVREFLFIGGEHLANKNQLKKIFFLYREMDEDNVKRNNKITFFSDSIKRLYQAKFSESIELEL